MENKRGISWRITEASDGEYKRYLIKKI